MSRFPRAFELLSVHEGGYVNHPDDPGGATNRGVIQRTYDAWRRRGGMPPRSVKQITDGEVEAIYRAQYWNAVRADDLPHGVAYCIFDAAVNSGVSRAAKWAQRIAGVTQDGIIGEQSLAAIGAMDAATFIDRYCDHRLAFMKRLRHWPTFKNGWTRRVAEVRQKAKEWAKTSIAPAPSKTANPTPRADGAQAVTALLALAITGAAAWVISKIKGKD